MNRAQHTPRLTVPKGEKRGAEVAGEVVRRRKAEALLSVAQLTPHGLPPTMAVGTSASENIAMNAVIARMVCAGSLALASATHAATLRNGFGLLDPDQTIDFESVTLAFNEPVVEQFAAFGVTFTDTFGNPDGNAYANMTGNRIGNFEGFVSYRPNFSMRFESHLRAVAFALVGQPGGWATAVAYRDGVAVETFEFETSLNNPINYYGFRGIVFDEIQIDVVSLDNAFMIDNLQTAAVPEASQAALLTAGLVALGAALKRRQR
jgi:hypothetical protein